MENFKDFEKQVKWENFKRDASDKLRNVSEKAKQIGMAAWDHRVELSALALGAAGIARTANKIANDSHERKYRDRMIYDQSTRNWYELRHKLSNRDILAVDDLMRSGMKKSEALRKLGLLK